MLTGVRICYSLSNSRSFIAGVRITQLQDPLTSAVALLDDSIPLVDPGPTCASSMSVSIDPTAGALQLLLTLNFGDTSDSITILAVGINTNP